AERAFILGGRHGLAVGQPGAGGRSDAGQDTGPDTDERAAKDLAPIAEPFLDSADPAAGQLDDRTWLVQLADAGGNFGQTKDAERDRDQGQAVGEEQAAERESALRGGGRGSDHPEEQPQEAG